MMLFTKYLINENALVESADNFSFGLIKILYRIRYKKIDVNICPKPLYKNDNTNNIPLVSVMEYASKFQSSVMHQSCHTS